MGPEKPAVQKLSILTYRSREGRIDDPLILFPSESFDLAPFFTAPQCPTLWVLLNTQLQCVQENTWKGSKTRMEVVANLLLCGWEEKESRSHLEGGMSGMFWMLKQYQIK